MRVSIVAVAVLAACAAPRVAPAAPGRPACTGPYSIEVVDEARSPLPTYAHRGRTYVRGEPGQRYLLRIRNASARRVEVVTSVDGRDVVDGRPAAYEKRGYLLAPYGELTIDGFRLGDASVAAFRFGAVQDSYAARMGDARDVGVVGVAFFPEAAPPPPRPLAEPLDRAPSGAERPSRSADAAPQAAPASPGEASRMRAEARPGLGTEFGEEHASPVEHVAFRRASARPAAVLELRYDDRRGLLALGIDVDRRGVDDRALREVATPFRHEGFAEPPPGWRGGR
jgi:hypothetical protein